MMKSHVLALWLVLCSGFCPSNGKPTIDPQESENDDIYSSIKIKRKKVEQIIETCLDGLSAQDWGLSVKNKMGKGDEEEWKIISQSPFCHKLENCLCGRLNPKGDEEKVGEEKFDEQNIEDSQSSSSESEANKVSEEKVGKENIKDSQSSESEPEANKVGEEKVDKENIEDILASSSESEAREPSPEPQNKEVKEISPPDVGRTKATSADSEAESKLSSKVSEEEESAESSSDDQAEEGASLSRDEELSDEETTKKDIAKIREDRLERIERRENEGEPIPPLKEKTVMSVEESEKQQPSDQKFEDKAGGQQAKPFKTRLRRLVRHQAMDNKETRKVDDEDSNKEPSSSLSSLAGDVMPSMSKYIDKKMNNYIIALVRSLQKCHKGCNLVLDEFVEAVRDPDLNGLLDSGVGEK